MLSTARMETLKNNKKSTHRGNAAKQIPRRGYAAAGGFLQLFCVFWFLFRFVNTGTYSVIGSKLKICTSSAYGWMSAALPQVWMGTRRSARQFTSQGMRKKR